MAMETNKEPRVPRLFDIQASVAYLRELGASSVTVNFIRTLINNGELPHVRMGRKFYCSRESLDRWIVNHEHRK